MSKVKIAQISSSAQSRATVYSGFAMSTDQGALVELYLNITSKIFEIHFKDE